MLSKNRQLLRGCIVVCTKRGKVLELHSVTMKTTPHTPHVFAGKIITSLLISPVATARSIRCENSFSAGLVQVIGTALSVHRVACVRSRV